MWVSLPTKSRKRESHDWNYNQDVNVPYVVFSVQITYREQLLEKEIENTAWRQVLFWFNFTERV